MPRLLNDQPEILFNIHLYQNGEICYPVRTDISSYNFQWTASGVIIVPGARVAPHVEAVSRDDPDIYKGLQSTVAKTVLARLQNLGTVEKIIVQVIFDPIFSIHYSIFM